MRNEKQRNGIKKFITGGDNTSFIVNQISVNKEREIRSKTEKIFKKVWNMQEQVWKNENQH